MRHWIVAERAPLGLSCSTILWKLKFETSTGRRTNCATSRSQPALMDRPASSNRGNASQG